MKNNNTANVRSVVGAFLSIFLAAGAVRANNIQVSGLSLTNIDTGLKTLDAKFNAQWENSWFLNPANPPGNYDAAWLVLKYHTGDNNWKTARLDTNALNHIAPVGFTIKIARNGTNGVGAMLHRSSAGSGTATANDVQLKWIYGADGVSNSALVSTEIHAIEMVFIPSNAFSSGDGTSNSVFRTGGSTVPFRITTPPTTIGTNAGLLQITSFNTNATYTFPPQFPLGLTDFYMMKYEVSQGQYADYADKTFSIGTPISGNSSSSRHVFTNVAPDLVATSPDRSMLKLENTGFYDYLDFVGLRPMTEFEYEKACRGPLFPVPGEYAWGTAVFATQPYTLANDGTSTEAVATGYNENAGNCWHPLTQGAAPANIGPCRVGMFAKPTYNGSTSGRIQSGAGYYGVMDLTGNGNELVIRAPVSGSDTNFVGTHGDGVLTTSDPSWANSQIWVQRGGGCTYREMISSTVVTGGVSAVSVQAPALNIYSAIRGVRVLVGP